MTQEFEEWRIFKSYRVIGLHDGQRLELTSNIATLELAGEIREQIRQRHPYLQPLTIDKYYTYQF